MQEGANGRVLPAATPVLRVDPRRRQAVLVEALRDAGERVTIEVEREDEADDLGLLGVNPDPRSNGFTVRPQLGASQVTVGDASRREARKGHDYRIARRAGGVFSGALCFFNVGG